MANKHNQQDLRQMQALPLEAKINMTRERIRAWYESWVRFEIHNDKTGKTRFVTMDCRDVPLFRAEPPLKEGEWIVSALPGAVYVSFSGGKDSTVLKHIVDNTPGVYDVPAVFVNTGLEYPEIQRFVKDVKAGKWDCFNPDVVILRPKMRFDEVIKKYGYPVISKEVSQRLSEARIGLSHGKETQSLKKLTGQYVDKNGNPGAFNSPQWGFLLEAPFNASHQCCNTMKKKPAKTYEVETGRVPIVATMAYESRLRKSQWLKNGCNAFESKRPISTPMAFWTEQDILHYIKEFNVPYCPVYGDIVVDIGDETIPDEQINIIDYLGDYEPEDKLKTTGCDRTGCIFCMFGCHLEGTPNRFQRLKKTHPRQYEYCINGGEMVDGKWQPSKEGLGLCKVLDYIGVEYE